MLEPTIGRFVAEDVIPEVAQSGDTIIVDPEKRGIIVTRYVSWSRYPKLMKHREQLSSLDPGKDVPPAPNREGNRAGARPISPQPMAADAPITPAGGQMPREED